MEYLLQGVNISAEICPMSAGGCTCQGGSTYCTPNECECNMRCIANCGKNFICGIGQSGVGPY